MSILLLFLGYTSATAHLTITESSKVQLYWYYGYMSPLDGASISIVEGGSIPGTYAEDLNGVGLDYGTVVTISLSNGYSFTSVVDDDLILIWLMLLLVHMILLFLL